MSGFVISLVFKLIVFNWDRKYGLWSGYHNNSNHSERCKLIKNSFFKHKKQPENICICFN